MSQLHNKPQHVCSNNVVCATKNASDQPTHTHSLIRAFASRLNILVLLKENAVQEENVSERTRICTHTILVQT